MTDMLARAGVSGLTSALQLAKDSNNTITVIARHMPGDYSHDYASPWAGANFQPYVRFTFRGALVRLTTVLQFLRGVAVSLGGTYMARTVPTRRQRARGWHTLSAYINAPARRDE